MRQPSRFRQGVQATEFALLPDQLPSVGQLSLQLCHIRVPDIAARVASAPRLPACDEIHGWFDAGQMDEFRLMVRRHVQSLLPTAAAAAAATTYAASVAAASAAARSSVAASSTVADDDLDDDDIDDGDDDDVGEDDDVDDLDTDMGDDDGDGDTTMDSHVDTDCDSTLPELPLQQQPQSQPPVPDDAEDLLVTLTSGSR